MTALELLRGDAVPVVYAILGPGGSGRLVGLVEDLVTLQLGLLVPPEEARGDVLSLVKGCVETLLADGSIDAIRAETAFSNAVAGADEAVAGHRPRKRRLPRAKVEGVLRRLVWCGGIPWGVWVDTRYQELSLQARAAARAMGLDWAMTFAGETFVLRDLEEVEAEIAAGGDLGAIVTRKIAESEQAPDPRTGGCEAERVSDQEGSDEPDYVFSETATRPAEATGQTLAAVAALNRSLNTMDEFRGLGGGADRAGDPLVAVVREEAAEAVRDLVRAIRDQLGESGPVRVVTAHSVY